jgi:eukaryotic-like serine/threonine-protein kinase
MRSQLTHYHILEQIGAGGMGVVYRAHDERLDRDVALKVLPSGTIPEESARRRFRKEALALSKLNHPNIATVFDFDTQDGTDFLVEELIEGRSLDTMVESGPLSAREIIHLGSQLAEGVAAAHERGILHRDLKPANIRITPDARLKILDFGLATMLHGQTGPHDMTESQSETKAVAGTLPYMAPEQLLGEKLDARTDIWALGCVLHEMTTGALPFPGSGTVLTDAILHRPVASPTNLNPQAAPGLESIILKCLEKDPDLRYQSAREIGVDLRRISGGSSSAVSPPVKARSRHLSVWSAGVAVLLLVAAALGFWYWHRPKDTRVGPPTIAVLPFVDMSAGKDQEYFSDGLADELINNLARIPEVRVTARTSSFQFKGRNEDLRSIGQKLNVASILEGSVRKDADRVRITLQLINVLDGFHVWSETYDRGTSDIFAVQEEIARSVANALRVTLLPGRVYSPRATNPQAYNAYLQGRYFQQRGTTEDIRRAAGYYQQALSLDPNFPPAWAWLSSAYSVLANSGDIPTQQGYQKSREAVEHALRLDPQSADAHRVLGNIKLDWDWDWSGAEVEYRRALELEPNSIGVLSSMARVSYLFGRCTDALLFARRTVELDPMRASTHVSLAGAIWNCGNLEDAIAVAKKALELNPKGRFHHYRLGKMYYQQGKFPESLEMLEQETVPAFRLLGLTLLYDKMGERQKSDAALQELVDKYHADSAFQIAEAYACRGEADNTFRWLQTAYDQHDPGLVVIKVTTCFNNVQGDPRYQRFLQKMKLP